MFLSTKDFSELERIKEKIILDTVTSDEMESFLDLIVQSGNESEMLNYMKNLGLNTIDEVRDEVKKRQRNSSISTGLVIASGAILLAALFSR